MGALSTVGARAPSGMHATLMSPCAQAEVPGSCVLGHSNPSVPYPVRKWELQEPRGAPAGCPVFPVFPPFLHVEKACTSPGSLIFLSGAQAPNVRSDPGTRSLPAPCPWPLLLLGGSRRSFPGGREARQPQASALRDGVCAAGNWSYLEKNRVKS